jgi:hypothetical protein
MRNGGLLLDSPLQGPAGSSLTIVSAQSHSTCRGKGKGLKDRPFPAPQFVAARRAFHNVMVKPGPGLEIIIGRGCQRRELGASMEGGRLGRVSF